MDLDFIWKPVVSTEGVVGWGVSREHLLEDEFCSSIWARLESVRNIEAK